MLPRGKISVFGFISVSMMVLVSSFLLLSLIFRVNSSINYMYALRLWSTFDSINGKFLLRFCSVPVIMPCGHMITHKITVTNITTIFNRLRVTYKCNTMINISHSPRYFTLFGLVSNNKNSNTLHQQGIFCVHITMPIT